MRRSVTILGLLLTLALPATQALCLGVELVHRHDHHGPHTLHSHDGAHLHAAEAHAEHHHPDEATLETLLHGHEHDESTPDHRHDASLRDGRTASVFPVAPSARCATRTTWTPPPLPSQSPPDDAPVAAAATPLCYTLCSLLI